MKPRRWLDARRMTPEWMDDPNLDPAEHQRALVGLGRLNTLGRTVAQIRPHLIGARTVVDVACGRGDLLRALIASPSDRRIGLGIDISPTAISIARSFGHNRVRYRVQDAIDPRRPLPCADVLLCSLFLHHLTDEQVIILLRRMAQAARRRVVVSDLERSVPNWLMIWSAARIVTRSRVVHHDSARSVEAGWKPAELHQLARFAGLRRVSVQRAFPGRLILLADPIP
jgi:2-polyprenyl-3-methyl-5-hydroxy-6-metoxy-1,4-benzoquinol methylase